MAVLNHPFFAVSDSSGRFDIPGLPAGTYRLVVWHEVFGEQEIEVTITAGDTRTADFTFDADKTKTYDPSAHIKLNKGFLN